MEQLPKGNGVKWGKLLVWAIAIFAVGYMAVVVFAQDTQPIAQTPAARKLYDTANYQACLAEDNLINAKINDYANGLLELTNEDLIRLNEKRDRDCALVMGL